MLFIELLSLCSWSSSRFSINLAYLCVVFNISNLGLNIFLTQFMFGLTEMPAHILCIWLLEIRGRKVSLMATTLLGGFFSFLVIMVPRGAVWSAVQSKINTTSDVSDWLLIITLCRYRPSPPCWRLGHHRAVFSDLGNVHMSHLHPGAVSHIHKVGFDINIYIYLFS